MSWSEELYKVYELACGQEFENNSEILLPISHSTMNAQIEITISENGEFVSSVTVDKSDACTIVPVTEDSGTRGSGIAPMPFADKLIYIAGDYSLYAEGKKSNNEAYFNAYMNQLKSWAESKYSHISVRAVYKYLKKSELIRDLVNSGTLLLDENGKLKEKVKISRIEQMDSFVRFRVHQNVEGCDETWKDVSLYDSFISFNNSVMDDVKLCYALGKELPVTYKHPAKIRNAGDRAKLISSNDESGFSYRGRFKDKTQAISVSYEFSQKAHNALKWLISRQGIRVGSLSLIVWSSGLKYNVPAPTDSLETEEDIFNIAADVNYEPKIVFKNIIEHMIYGHLDKFGANEKVMIMGIDAATQGRASMSVYSELKVSDYLKNIEKWHDETKCYAYDYKNKCRRYKTFSIRDIANCAFGTEMTDGPECKSEVYKETVLRLLPCITEGKSVPYDIVNALYHKASRPLAYEKDSNHKKVLDTACGIIQKYYIQKGKNYMGYDPTLTDRSYLFGCLLAIADKAEKDTYAKGEARTTNATRYWERFANKPYETWNALFSKLQTAYFTKLPEPAKIKYQKLISEIAGKMSAEEFSLKKKLEPLYLLGYHHFTAELYKKNTENTEE